MNRVETIQTGAICECCGGGDVAYLCRKRGVHLYRCTRCGLAFVRPQPSDERLAALYRRSTGYYAKEAVRLAGSSPAPALALQAVLARHGLSGGRLLEVGCTGNLLYHMGRSGWTTVGVEVNADAAAVARDNGVDVREGDLDSAALPPNSFDAVFLGHVLEHLRSPRSMLARVLALLRPGGLLVVAVPNAFCGFARATLPLTRAGLPWPHAEPPYHLFEFTPKSLELLVHAVGFRMEEQRTQGRRPFAYLLGATGLFEGLKSKIMTSSVSRSLLPLLAASPALAAVSLLLAPFYAAGVVMDLWTRTGDAILAVARKPE